MAVRLVSLFALVGAIASSLPAQVEASKARDHKWTGVVESVAADIGIANAVVTAVCATDHGSDERWGTTDDVYTAPVSTVSDVNGAYAMSLHGGACWAYVAPPAGFERSDGHDFNTALSIDLGASPLRSRTVLVPASETGSVTTAATGAAVADTIWDDHNGNGVRDGGELGRAGVVVTLYDGGGHATARAVTDVNGMYRFENLSVGDYRVGVSDLPEDVVVTAAAQGADHTTDSDADPLTGRSALVHVPVTRDEQFHMFDIGLRSATGDPVTLRSAVVFPAPSAGAIAPQGGVRSTLSLVVLTLIGIIAASLLAGLARPRRLLVA
jgi:hypothetical protein